MIMGGEKERDEISPEVKGKVQQVAFLLKPFFFLQASMKDEREQKILGTFRCLPFSLLFFSFLFTNISHASFLSDGKKIKTIFCAASRTQFAENLAPR